ncbi:MAG: hypothetical protein OHK0022_47600 [Roseiflexaceae bacterium]
MKRYTLVLLALALLAGCGGSPAVQTGQTAGAERPPVPTDAPAATAVPTTPAAPTGSAPAATAAPVATATPAATAEAAPSGGASVVYQVPDDGSLRAIDLAGGAEVVLGDPTEPSQRLPWSASPDGRTVALVTGGAWLGRQEQPPRAALWTVGVDGSNPRRLLDLIGTTPFAGSLVGDWIALVNQTFQRLPWVPDGRAVVVASAHEGQVDLYAVDVASGAARRLTDTPTVEFGAAVAPDGHALAYGSASSFGTGAGWADVQGWLLPLAGGAPRPAFLPESSSEPPAGLTVAGWLDSETLVVQTTGMGATSSTIWLTQGDAQPQPFYRLPGLAVLDLQAGRLHFADQIPGQNGSLWSWQPGQSAAQQRASLAPAEAVYASPHGEEVLICPSERGPSGGLLLWSQGQLRQVSGGCGRPAWPASGRVALPGDPSSDGAGLIVGLDGGVQFSLGPGGIPAGWLDDTLYFFARNGAQWQLVRSDGTNTQPLAPVAAAPEDPQLVIRTP